MKKPSGVLFSYLTGIGMALLLSAQAGPRFDAWGLPSAFFAPKDGVFVINNNDPQNVAITDAFIRLAVIRGYGESVVTSPAEFVEKARQAGAYRELDRLKKLEYDLETERRRAYGTLCTDCSRARETTSVPQFKSINDLLAAAQDIEAAIQKEEKHIRENYAGVSDEDFLANAMIQLQELLKKKDAVDVFIFSHTNSFHKILANLPVELRKKIRLVYNAACYDRNDADEWLKLGVGAYVGHTGESASPVFVDTFMSEWKHGGSVAQAVAVANDLAQKRLKDADKFSPGMLKTYGDGTVAEAFGRQTMTVHSHRR